MSWFKVDDSFHSHPKTLRCSLAAIGLWSVAGSWASNHATDGQVPDYVVVMLSRGRPELADELVAAGLWVRESGTESGSDSGSESPGYRFHEWDADSDGTPRNPTRAEAKTARGKQSAGGAIGNHRRWHVARGVVDARCRYCQQERADEHPEMVGEAGGSDRVSGQPSDRSTDRVTDRVGSVDPNPPIPSRPDPTLKEKSGGARTRAPRKRGSRLPEDFTVTADMVAWARQNAPDVDGRRETEKFCNYWWSKTGKDATKLDWERTWRNWMLRAQEQAEERRSRTAKPTTDDKIAAFLAKDYGFLADDDTMLGTGTDGPGLIALPGGDEA